MSSLSDKFYFGLVHLDKIFLVGVSTKETMGKYEISSINLTSCLPPKAEEKPRTNIADFHFYITFIKFGIDRATYNTSPEMGNRRLSRAEWQALVNRFDGEFTDCYFDKKME